ncbi:thiamine-phosphate pyrophosphorylase [Lachnospiraceae bacterium C7]|nr:thiamine-phosphate pyrophosphorylase [Lachnospiraceae bacterium C7]
MENFNENALTLYAVTDSQWLNGRKMSEVVEEAIDGGATFVQYREKSKIALDREKLLQEAKDIKAVCKKHGVPFVIDDDVELAIACDADGVHVGQDDMDPIAVRKLIGNDKIVGVSAHNVREAILAEQKGADYLGVGAVFPTGTKSDATVLDFLTLKDITQTVDIPVVAIGGINMDNIHKLTRSGIRGISVVSAIFAQNDIKLATKELKKETERMLKNQC